jgi:hypothetical protein
MIPPSFMLRYSLRWRGTKSSRPLRIMPKTLRNLKTTIPKINEPKKMNPNLTKLLNHQILPHSLQSTIKTNPARSQTTMISPAKSMVAVKGPDLPKVLLRP